MTIVVGFNRIIQRRLFSSAMQHQYFSGSPLDRLSFLRSDLSFLDSALTHNSTKFVILSSGPNFDPAVNGNNGLNYLGYKDVATMIGRPFNYKTEQESIDAWCCDHHKSESAVLVFLGLLHHHHQQGQQVGEEEFSHKAASTGREFHGTAYFAVCDRKSTLNLEYASVRPDYSLPPQEAAIYAQARSFVDWNIRNKFCPGCGQLQMTVHAGTKKLCPPTSAGIQCPTRNGQVTNIQFPRTDPTMIVAVVNSVGDRILLGRAKRFASKLFYSCLAGFLEPGESIEEAVIREVYEESGIRISNVLLHSTQPWPFPSSLMIGCVAIASSNEISLDYDPELVDARWFGFDEVRYALSMSDNHTTNKSSSLTPPPSGPSGIPSNFIVPPHQAIAHTLMDAVVNHNFHRNAISRI